MRMISSKETHLRTFQIHISKYIYIYIMWRILNIMAPTTCLKAPTPNKSFMMRQNIQTSSHYQILMESFLASCETKGHHTVFAFFCRDLLRRSPRRPKKKVSRGKGACIELDREEMSAHLSLCIPRGVFNVVLMLPITIIAHSSFICHDTLVKPYMLEF